MSKQGNFLRRWSRRKREATAESAAPEHNKAKSADATPPPAATDHDTFNKPFDLADLPPIESIAAKTDIRAFLQAGIPPELKRAALRRAWSTDPKIRDFIGLVENGWDFNDPGGIPGFGELSAGEVARLLEQAIGAPASQQEPAQNAPVASAGSSAALLSGSGPNYRDRDQAPLNEQPDNTLDAKTPPCGMSNNSGKDVAQPIDPDIASQNNNNLEHTEGNRCTPRRRHGGALPK